MASIKAPVKVLERGDIYFFYRLTVPEKKGRVEPEGNMTYAGGMEDIQHFFFVLHPAGKKAHRMLLMGAENCATVAAVADSGEAIKAELAEKHARAKTKGAGVYEIVKHGDHTHLVYALETPQKPGEVRNYILSVKNPTDTAAEPPELLDHEGTELLLVGTAADSAEIFQDLKLWKKEHTLAPLFKGQ